MYLNKRVYPSRDQINHLTIKRLNPDKISYIVEDFGYWRKANAIHKWFVDNVQHGEDDCKEYYIPHDKLEELLGTVEDVLANHSLARSLLPTESGFFFGETKYDKYYFESLEETKEILTSALKEEDAEFYYRASW